MNYKQLYEKNAAWYNQRPTAKKILLLVNQYLPLLFFVGYAGIALLFLFKDSYARETIAVYFAAPATTLAITSALRLVISRPRPYDADGAGIIPLGNKKMGKFSSCPSRHLACAVAIALVFFSISAPLAIFAILVCGLMAYTRFAVGFHYPSDILLGATIACFLHAAFMVLLAIL